MKKTTTPKIVDKFSGYSIEEAKTKEHFALAKVRYPGSNKVLERKKYKRELKIAEELGHTIIFAIKDTNRHFYARTIVGEALLSPINRNKNIGILSFFVLPSMYKFGITQHIYQLFLNILKQLDYKQVIVIVNNNENAYILKKMGFNYFNPYSVDLRKISKDIRPAAKNILYSSVTCEIKL